MLRRWDLYRMDELITDKANYNRGYDDGYAFAIEQVLDISKQMRYNDNLSWHNETLEELEQRIV